MNIHDNRYVIGEVIGGIRRVAWKGPLECEQPASDAEKIALAAIHTDEDDEDRVERVEVDLSECHAFNTRGLAMLVYLRRRFARYEASWSLVSVPVPIARSLELLNLDGVFHVRDFPAHADPLLADEPYHPQHSGNGRVHADIDDDAAPSDDESVNESGAEHSATQPEGHHG